MKLLLQVMFRRILAEFILGTNYPSETNYMSEKGNSSAYDGYLV